MRPNNENTLSFYENKHLLPYLPQVPWFPHPYLPIKAHVRGTAEPSIGVEWALAPPINSPRFFLAHFTKVLVIFMLKADTIFLALNARFLCRKLTG